MHIFDVFQNRSEAFVFGDGRMGHTLVHVEDRIWKGVALPHDHESTIRIGVGVHVFFDQAARYIVLLQHDPLAVV